MAGILAPFLDQKTSKKFLNYKVFNGDKSDLRFNDPKNVIIGLYAKGRALKKIKQDLCKMFNFV